MTTMPMPAAEEVLGGYPATYQATSWLGLAKHFVDVVRSSTKGKALLATWGAYFVWVAALPRRGSASPASPTSPASPAAATEKDKEKDKPPRGRGDLARLLQVLRPHLTKSFGGLLMAYVATLSTRVLVTVRLADMSGELAGLQGARRWGSMFDMQATFAIVCFVAAWLTALMKYLEKRVALSLRSILFKHMLTQYFAGDSFAHQDLEDASSRLTADVTDFSVEATHALGHFLKPLVDTVHLAFVMARRMGVLNLAIFLGFFGVQDRILKRVRQRALPRSLKDMALETQQLEAELRERISRLHVYREQIALQGGADTEKLQITDLYSRIRAHALEEQAAYAFLDGISSYSIKYGGLMCAFSALTPSNYLDPTRSAQKITSEFIASSSLLGALASAVKDLGDSLGQLPRVRGLAQRIRELEERLELVRKRRARGADFAMRREGDAIRISKLTVQIPVPLDAPEGTPPVELTKDLDLVVPKGTHVTCRGENGAGKTSLLRTVAGLWAGRGEVQLPKSTFVCPQDTYFPRGSLLSQLTYPDMPGALQSVDADEALSVKILEEVGLTELGDRYGKPLRDIVEDWPSVLSGGQKQRLALGRLLYRAKMGRAEFALLDEPTSAVAASSVVELVRAVKASGVSVMTISHTDVLDKEHDVVLRLERGGGWQVEALR